MSAFWFTLIGALLIAMALLGRFIDRLPLSPAMVYLLVGMALGPAALNALELHPLRHLELLQTLTEVALLIALFSVGIKMRVPLKDPRWLLPVRLATLTLLATVAGVALVAWLFFDFDAGLALVLGAALAPTDPVLASEVQLRTPEDRDALRFGLTGEAGLNDGTAFPLVLLGLGLLAGGEGFSLWRWFGVDLLWSVAMGVSVGFAVGTVLATVVRTLRARFSNAVIDELLLLGVIALSYGIALAIHAMGFLAVFAAGVALRRADVLHHRLPDASADGSLASPLTPTLLQVNEQLERLAEVAIVLLVGIIISSGYWSSAGLGVAALLFLVIRPLSVHLGLMGGMADARAGTQRRLLGWFGIRGIGSFYYALYAVNLGSDAILFDDAHKLLSCVFTVIAASILVHGVSAAPLMALYQRRRLRSRAQPPVMSDKR